MCATPRSRCLDLACFLAAFVCACGGQLVSPQATDGGNAVGQTSGDDGASPTNPAPTPSTTPVAPAPTSSATAPVTSGMPNNCGLSVVNYYPAGTPDCWPCARDACAAEASACAADCMCNGAVSQSLSCVANAGGGLVLSCFQPYIPLAESEPAFTQFVTCLVDVANQCCMIDGDGGLELRDASAD